MPLSHDPLDGYVVHFTRGNDSKSAEEARQRGADGNSLPATLKWLNEIDDTDYRVSLSILWDGHIQATTYAMGHR